MPSKQILIELDALLDTRVSTIKLMDATLLPKLFASDYRNRISDEFSYYLPGFDDKLFAQHYANRNLAQLNNCLMTDITVSILEIMDQEIKRVNGGDPTAANPILGEFQITVNYYPYTLSTENIEVYRLILATVFGLKVTDINFDYIPLKKMTADWLRASRWALIIYYNWFEWAKAAFQVKDPPPGSPDTTVLVPGLLEKRVSMEQLKKINDPNLPTKDPFEMQKIILSKIMGIEFLKPSSFTHVDIKELEKRNEHIHGLS